MHGLLTISLTVALGLNVVGWNIVLREGGAVPSVLMAEAWRDGGLPALLLMYLTTFGTMAGFTVRYAWIIVSVRLSANVFLAWSFLLLWHARAWQWWKFGTIQRQMFVTMFFLRPLLFAARRTMLFRRPATALMTRYVRLCRSHWVQEEAIREIRVVTPVTSPSA